MSRARKLLLVAGIVLGASIGLLVWLSPVTAVPVMASTTPASRKEYGAAFLGLFLLFILALGLDWQDWM